MRRVDSVREEGSGSAKRQGTREPHPLSFPPWGRPAGRPHAVPRQPGLGPRGPADICRVAPRPRRDRSCRGWRASCPAPPLPSFRSPSRFPGLVLPFPCPCSPPPPPRRSARLVFPSRGRALTGPGVSSVGSRRTSQRRGAREEEGARGGRGRKRDEGGQIGTGRRKAASRTSLASPVRQDARSRPECPGEKGGVGREVGGGGKGGREVGREGEEGGSRTYGIRRDGAGAGSGRIPCWPAGLVARPARAGVERRLLSPRGGGWAPEAWEGVGEAAPTHDLRSYVVRASKEKVCSCALGCCPTGAFAEGVFRQVAVVASVPASSCKHMASRQACRRMRHVVDESLYTGALAPEPRWSPGLVRERVRVREKSPPKPWRSRRGESEGVALSSELGGERWEPLTSASS